MAVYIKSALFLAIAFSLIMGSIADDDDILSGLNITRGELVGRVVCSATGNTVLGVTPVGVANVTVTLKCDDDDDDDDDDDAISLSVLTNSSGFFIFANASLASLLSDDLDDCTVKVQLPLPNCTTSLPTGTLEAVPRLAAIVDSSLGRTARFIAGLFRLLTGDDED